MKTVGVFANVVEFGHSVGVHDGITSLCLCMNTLPELLEQGSVRTMLWIGHSQVSFDYGPKILGHAANVGLCSGLEFAKTLVIVVVLSELVFAGFPRD